MRVRRMYRQCVQTSGNYWSLFAGQIVLIRLLLSSGSNRSTRQNQAPDQTVPYQSLLSGQEFRTHTHTGSHVMLFARRRHDDRAFLFLGPATYVTHTSDRPMQITWRLHHPVPPDLLAWLAIAS